MMVLLADSGISRIVWLSGVGVGSTGVLTFVNLAV